MKHIQIIKDGDIKTLSRYQIDNEGNVISLIGTPKQLKPQLIGGYKGKNKYLAISVDGKIRYIHQLMVWTYLGIDYIKDNLTIDHIDGNKYNNTIENLEIISQGQNNTRAFEKGLMNPNKLQSTSKQIIEITFDGKVVNNYIDYHEAVEKTGIQEATLRAKLRHIPKDFNVDYNSNIWTCYNKDGKIIYTTPKKQQMFKWLESQGEYNRCLVKRRLTYFFKNRFLYGTKTIKIQEIRKNI